MKNDPIIKEAIANIIEALNNENFEPFTRSFFKGHGIPSDRWSFFNRLIMFLNGTSDARTFLQWKEVKRNIKKGAKAFYIFAPVIIRIPVEKTEYDRQDEEVIEKLVGFKTVPVFRYEDTEGEELKIYEYKVDIPYCFKPLIKHLKLKITTRPFNGLLGSYSPVQKEISLASPDIDVFLHEIAHAVDMEINGNNISNVNIKDTEIVAELSGAVVGYMMGYKIPLREVKRYIEIHGGKIIHLLDRVDRVVSYIIEKTKTPIQLSYCS